VVSIGPKEKDNLLRWDGEKRGFYEVYYLKWNHAQSHSAGWIRYTLTSPLLKAGEPCCELWGIFFDTKDPASSFAVKQRYSIDRLTWDRDRFRVGIADASLEMNHCHGSITDRERGNFISWDLEFDSKTPTLYYYPWKRFYSLPLPRTKVLVPHLDATFSGKLTASGRKIELEGARGEQTHLWGTKHNLRWVWGHCNTFEEDDSAVFEGADGQVKHGPVRSAHFKMFYIKTRDREHLFNAPLKWLLNRSKVRLGHWEFEAHDKQIRILGEISSDLDRFVGVTYQDPDGQPLWCNNTKIASIRLRLFHSDGRPISELTSQDGCAFELADRKIYPEVPIQI
jgi:hypothetical protein